MTDQIPADPNPTPPPAPAAPPPAAPPPAAPPPAAPTSAAAGARPTGITILAILAGIGGVLGLLGGFVLLFAGTVVFGGLGAILGLAALAYAGLLIAFAYGAWTLQPWAWPLGVAGAIFGIVISVLYIVGGQSIASQALGIVVDGAILYYLNQPGIKSLFGRS